MILCASAPMGQKGFMIRLKFRLKENDSVAAMLENHDAYHALEAVNGLIRTGPTGTNVNDIAIGLIG